MRSVIQRFLDTSALDYVREVLTFMSMPSIAEFYYSQSGIAENAQCSPLDHLVIGRAHGIAANGRNLKNMDYILNWAKYGGIYYAQIGIPTGEEVKESPQVYWRFWVRENSIVYKVKWITDVVVVPQKYFDGKRQVLSNVQKQEIFNYMLSR